MEQAVREACDAAARLLDEYAPVEIVCERYAEKDRTRKVKKPSRSVPVFHGRGIPQTRVMIETSMDEQLLKPSCNRKVIHEYGEPLEAQVQVYALEEIIAEKLRAILQHLQRFEQRGWSRSRARDYYDLWRVLGTYKNQMDLSDFAPLLGKKCAVRNVTFKTPTDFFPEAMLAYVEKTWEQWLRPLVPGLPSFDTVIGQLRPQIAALIP